MDAQSTAWCQQNTSKSIEIAWINAIKNQRKFHQTKNLILKNSVTRQNRP